MKKFKGKVPPMNVYNKPKRRGRSKRDTGDEVQETLLEITPQVRQAFHKVVDINQLREEVLHGVDVLTAGSAQPPDPVAEASTVITTAQIEIRPTETGKPLFLFQDLVDVSRLVSHFNLYPVFL